MHEKAQTQKIISTLGKRKAKSTSEEYKRQEKYQLLAIGRSYGKKNKYIKLRKLFADKEFYLASL